MNNTFSARRLVENELIARKANEKVARVMKIVVPGSEAVFFYCECSNTCQERIPLSVAAYQKIHNKRDRFIVLPGHTTKSVESVVESNPSYCVVEKYT